MTRAIVAILAVLLIATDSPGVPAIASIDHIPTAVRDLDTAVADFAALGFVLKPGRHHDNGLRNAHVKFPDGSYIELISPAAGPIDALAADYVRKLRGGDGPAFVGFNANDRATLVRRLARSGLSPDDEDGMLTFPATSALHPFFFTGQRTRAATDRPEHYAHPNTAYSVWAVRVAANRAGRDMLTGLTGPARETTPCERNPRGTAILPLDRGEIVLLPGIANATRITGATIMVRDIARARAILTRNRVRFTATPGCPHWLWIDPARTHGLSLALREVGAPVP